MGLAAGAGRAEAIGNGATEIDMVMNMARFMEGKVDDVRADIAAVVAAARGAVVKVIIETDYLESKGVATRAIPELCALVHSAGAHFIKTSTGFAYVKASDGQFKCVGATAPHVRLMVANAPPGLLVKPSGGVRNLGAALKCFGLGASRIGLSACKAILDEARAHEARLPELLQAAMDDDSVLGGGY
jgi:deoxyribose-phosphate aldolase